MATHSLSALSGSISSLFNTTQSVGSISSFNKVNWVFGLFLAGLSYCAYRTYRLSQHTSYGLNDSLKLAKCHALYAEAKNKNFQDVQTLLEQCEEMLVSITDKTLLKDKEILLVKLAHHYKQDNPAHSFDLAQRLSLSDNIFNVASSLIGNLQLFNHMLNELFVKALEAKKQENKQLDVDTLLSFAKAFRSVNFYEPSNQSLHEAQELANSHKEILPRIRTYCQIAQYQQEIGSDAAQTSIESAQDLLNDLKTSAEKIEARLLLADIYFSFENFDSMNTALKNVLESINQTDQNFTAKNVYLLAKLQNKIKNTAEASKKFKNFNVEGLINKILENLAANLSDGNRIEDCLTLANIYQEKLVKESGAKQTVLGKALEYINRLPQYTSEEIDSKINFLERLSSFFEDQDKKGEVILRIVELYNHESHSEPVFRLCRPAIGSKILKLYNKAELKEKSDSFFQYYLANLLNTNAMPDWKIGQLAAYAQHIDNGGYLTTEQTKAMLEATTELLLPQLDPYTSYEDTISMIIEGYSQIDTQKSLELLANYQDKQAKSCKITAAVSAALAGMTYFFHRVGLPLSGAAVVTRLWAEWR